MRVQFSFVSGHCIARELCVGGGTALVRQRQDVNAAEGLADGAVGRIKVRERVGVLHADQDNLKGRSLCNWLPRLADLRQGRHAADPLAERVAVVEQRSKDRLEELGWESSASRDWVRHSHTYHRVRVCSQLP